MNNRLRGWETLLGTDASRFVDPTSYVTADSLLFIDTNVFMDTSPARRGGVSALIEACKDTILAGGNPVIIPTKVIDELKKHAAKDRGSLPREKAEAFEKAARALQFIEGLSGLGLARNDLGASSNPYADDLFVTLFESLATRYALALLTNDLTLRVRLRLLAESTRSDIIVGELTQDGLIERTPDQALYERAYRKRDRLSNQVRQGAASLHDQKELDSLNSLLPAFRSAFQTVDPTKRTTPSPGSQTRTATKDIPHPNPQAFQVHSEPDDDDALLPRNTIPNTGQTVYKEAPGGREPVILGNALGTGGEGTAFETNSGHVVKIFDKTHITRHREAKISLLVNRQLKARGIAFPEAVITNAEGQFVGYLMERAVGRELQRSIFNPRKFRREYPDWTKSDLVELCISFLEKVVYLHSLNIIIGDINPKNLLVDQEREVTLIDADSWQIEGYPCPVGTPMFTSPSLAGQSFSSTLRTKEDESFAVATMLFMIVIPGAFPYARKGGDGDITRAIKGGLFAYQYKDKSNRDQPAGNWRHMWSHLSPEIKRMFWHTFHKDGDRYARRPSANEWLGAFIRYRTFLTSSENFDPMSADVFPTRDKARDPSTPIYECAQCGTSLVGRWSDASGTYKTPRLCHSCRVALPKCSDCGRPRESSSLQDGRCYACNRKRNYASCLGCGQEKPIRNLQDGRCYTCNRGACSDCGRVVSLKYLHNGLCDRCQLAACVDCGRSTKRSELSRSRCATCTAQESAFDTTRPCTRCEKPFITYGNVRWHQRHGKPVPTTHKNTGGYYPPECVAVERTPTPKRSPSATKARPTAPKNEWCFIASAAYGSYDAPEVKVLREWRDTRLKPSRGGRLTISLYYWLSPPLARLAHRYPWLRVIARRLLEPLVNTLRNQQQP